MTSECDRLRADAPGLASLEPDDPERLAARLHARDCPGCARSLREAERLQGLIASATTEPPPAGALERSSRAILSALRREARRRALASAGAAAGALAAAAGLARHPSHDPADWTLAAAIGLLAVGLAAVSRRRPLLVAACAAGAALASAVVTGHAGPLDVGEGVRCLATELAGAAAVIGAGWVALSRTGASASRAALGASAAAGALAGTAALAITCTAHGSLPHLLAFHVGGVLLGAAAAAALGRRAPHPAG